jgi:hypothetical protein
VFRGLTLCDTLRFVKPPDTSLSYHRRRRLPQVYRMMPPEYGFVRWRVLYSNE